MAETVQQTLALENLAYQENLFFVALETFHEEGYPFIFPLLTESFTSRLSIRLKRKSGHLSRTDRS
jgi:hypothetical protein